MKFTSIVFLMIPSILFAKLNDQKIHKILDHYKIEYNSIDFVEQTDNYDFIIDFLCHKKENEDDCIVKMNKKLNKVSIKYVVHLTRIIPRRKLTEKEKKKENIVVIYDLETFTVYQPEKRRRVAVVLDQYYRVVLTLEYQYQAGDLKFIKKE